MRKIFKKVILVVLLTLPISVTAQNESYDWNKVIDAIIKVESKGNSSAKSKDCVGILQIRPILVADCNEYLQMKKSKKRYSLSDRLSSKKSKEMFILYQKRYNQTNNVEKAIRLWNGGCGYSVAKTEAYYQKVMKHYNKKGS